MSSTQPLYGRPDVETLADEVMEAIEERAVAISHARLCAGLVYPYAYPSLIDVYQQRTASASAPYPDEVQG